MNNFSIITFNFNEYDMFRTHFISPKFDYLFITDGVDAPKGWKHISFSKEDPWYDSLYVRYHPFEFTDSEYVLVIDSSLSSNSNIEELANRFIYSDCDVGVLLSQDPLLFDRIYKWKNRHRISQEETDRLLELTNKIANIYYKGTIAGAVRLYHNTEKTREYLKKCWELLFYNSKIIRLDEIPSTLALELVDGLHIFPLSTHLIQGDVFQYHLHNQITEAKLSFNKTKFWLMDKRISPVLIGNAYHRKYEYKTEAICLTKYLSEIGLKEWIDHHLNIGFNHIHIFDNESPYPCEQICKEYGDKVSYEYVEGYARHYKLYDDYINSDICKAEWVLAIDDDEYFELNKDICKNIGECIDWYKNKFPNDEMFAIRWKHLFPKKFHTEPIGNILEYCTEENSKLAELFQLMGDRGVKTIVHRKGYIHYEEAEENPRGGHVPVHKLVNSARLYDGELVNSCSCRKIPVEENEPARIIHCRFKGYTWYKNKYMNPDSKNYCFGNCSAKPYIKRYKFNEILDILD